MKTNYVSLYQKLLETREMIEEAWTNAHAMFRDTDISVTFNGMLLTIEDACEIAENAINNAMQELKRG